MAAFAAWQAVAAVATGQLPLLSSQGKNLVVPMTDLIPAVGAWWGSALSGDRQGLIDLGQFLVLCLVVGLAARRVGRESGPLACAWLASCVLVLSLSANVWKGPADFRTAAEVWVLSAAMLIRGGGSLRLPATVAVMTLVATMAFRITSL